MKCIRTKMLAALGVMAFFCMVQAPVAEGGDVAAIKKRGNLIVAMTGTNLAFNMVNATGKEIGYDVDVSNAVADRLGVGLEVQISRWAGLIPSLTSNKVDMIAAGMTITEKRREVVDFSIPYFQTYKALIVNKRRQPNAKTVQEFNRPDISVGVVTGSTDEIAAMRILPKAQALRFDSYTSVGLEVKAGRVDVMMADVVFAKIYTRKNPDEIYFVEQPDLQPEEYAVAVQKGNESLLKLVNDTLTDLKNSGRLDKMYEKWFVTMEWVKDIGLGDK
jgi:polar amino acid transport system substrate-binding protein